MYSPAITPLALDQILESFVTSDPRVGRFRVGETSDQDPVLNDPLPLVYYALVSSRISRKNFQTFNTYTVRVFAFDQLLEDRSNAVQIFSDTQGILSDVLLRMMNDPDLEEKGFRWDQDIELDYTTHPMRSDLLGCCIQFDVVTPILLCHEQLPGS